MLINADAFIQTHVHSLQVRCVSRGTLTFTDLQLRSRWLINIHVRIRNSPGFSNLQ